MSEATTHRAALARIASAACAGPTVALAATDSTPLAPAAGTRTLAEEFEEAWTAEIELQGMCIKDGDYERLIEPLSDKTASIVKRILAVPARDIEGLKLKGRAFLWCYSNDIEVALACLAQQSDATDVKLIHSIMRDLIAL